MKKKWTLILIISLTIIVIISGIVVLYVPRKVSKLISYESEIVSIKRIDVKEIEQEKELAKEDFYAFIELINEIKYIKRYNFLQYKYIEYTDVIYQINFSDNTIIEICDVHYYKTSFDGVTTIRIEFAKVVNNKFPEIDILFM